MERLIRLASRKLGDLPRRVADEEDVVLSAFNDFLRGVEDGRFTRLDDRDDLWQVLVMLTERKAIGLRRHDPGEKRGGGQVRGESAVEMDRCAAVVPHQGSVSWLAASRRRSLPPQVQERVRSAVRSARR